MKDEVNHVDLVRRLKKRLGTNEDNLVATVENIIEEKETLREEVEELS